MMIPLAFVYVTSVFEGGFRLPLHWGWEYNCLSLDQALLVGGVGRKEGKRTVFLSWLALLQSLSCYFRLFFGLTLTNLWWRICKRHPNSGSSRRICMHSITSLNSPLSICPGSPLQSLLCLGSPSRVVGHPLDVWQTHTFLIFPSSVWTASLPAPSQPCHLTPIVLSSCSNKHNGQIHKTSK